MNTSIKNRVIASVGALALTATLSIAAAAPASAAPVVEAKSISAIQAGPVKSYLGYGWNAWAYMGCILRIGLRNNAAVICA